MLEHYSLFLDPPIELLGWHPPSTTRCWGGLGVLLGTPHLAWAPKLQLGIYSFGDLCGSGGSLWGDMAGENTKRNNDITGEVQYSFVWDLLLNHCTGIWYAPCHAVFFHPLCTLWNQGCQMRTVWIVIEVSWYEDPTTSCLFINSLCFGSTTSVDIVDADDDPNIFYNWTVALLLNLGDV